MTEIALGERSAIAVQVTSSGYAGPIGLDAVGLPASWDVTWLPSPAVNVAPGQIADAIVEVSVPSDGEAVSATLSIQATAGDAVATAAAMVSVTRELVIEIPAGTGEGRHPFPPGTPIRPGTIVTFLNSDSMAHRIHSRNDEEGFPHQDGDSEPGESYAVTVTGSGGLDYYCHEHGEDAGVGVLVVSP